MIGILTLVKSTQTLLIRTLMTLVIGILTLDILTVFIDFEILVLRMLTLRISKRLCIPTLVMDIY